MALVRKRLPALESSQVENCSLRHLFSLLPGATLVTLLLIGDA